MQSGGLDAFKAVMQEPLEELPSIYRDLPIYYITNRFTVVGPCLLYTSDAADE